MAGPLLEDIRSLVESARQRAAQAVNVELTVLHWHIGERIRKDILGQERAEYGEQIVGTLSQQLTGEYGRGFSRRNLFNMIRFAEVFPNIQIVQTLSAQLIWSHFLEIISLKEPLQRDFHAEMCRVERWSVRTLHSKIGGILYERTVLSRKHEKLIRQQYYAFPQLARACANFVPEMIRFGGV